MVYVFLLCVFTYWWKIKPTNRDELYPNWYWRLNAKFWTPKFYGEIWYWLNDFPFQAEMNKFTGMNGRSVVCPFRSLKKQNWKVSGLEGWSWNDNAKIVSFILVSFANLSSLLERKIQTTRKRWSISISENRIVIISI